MVISHFRGVSQDFWPVRGRKTSTPTQGYGLGRGNGGISLNFTKHQVFSEISEINVILVKNVEIEKRHTFPPEADNLALAHAFS